MERRWAFQRVISNCFENVKADLFFKLLDMDELVSNCISFKNFLELTVILQDRINDLLVANVGLEKEVMKLRQSVKNFNEDALERTK